MENDNAFISNLRANLLAAVGKKLNSLEPGSLVGDNYVLENKINEGGSGEIYKCHRKDDKRKVFALKVCIPKSANAARRFQAEVTASYQVIHPNVLRSIDCFFHGDAITYVMEYAPGGDLRDILDLRESIPIETIVILARQLCAGLSAIHEKGIIHRDIKPENILFSTDGQLKIADFGISFTGDVARVTNNGSLVGTVNYMAPEYVQRGVFDGRSDLYSLGVMIYEMICGELPLGYSKTLDELVEKMHKGFTPVIEKRHDCPPKLSNIVTRLLSLDPQDRFPSASAVELEIAALEREFLVGLGDNDEDLDELLRNRTKQNKGLSSRLDFFGLVVFLCVVITASSLCLAFLKKYDVI